MNYWDQLRNYLRQKVSAQEYENWLSGASYLGVRDGALSVAVPDPQPRAWLEGEYALFVQSGIREMALPIRSVTYQVDQPRGGQNQANAVLDHADPDVDVNSTCLLYTSDAA